MSGTLPPHDSRSALHKVAASMKIPGICFPYDIWYDIKEDNNASVTWMGHGVWAAIDILHLIGQAVGDLQPVTKLSESTVTHPILQTVMDARVDVAPIEVRVAFLSTFVSF